MDPYAPAERTGDRNPKRDPPASPAPASEDTHVSTKPPKTNPLGKSAPPLEPRAQSSDDLNGGNIDKVRDILFGGQMRDYERRFQELNQRLEAELVRMREAQDKRLAQIDRRVDDQFEKLNKLVRQEIEDRNGAVDDLESRLQQAARTSRAEVNKSLEGLGRDIAASDERLRGAIADLQASLVARAGEAESAFQRAGAELRAEKVGRDDLAALLTEFALRLRGDFDLPSPK